MAKIEHDNDWSEFFSRYNDAEENLHKVEPEPKPESLTEKYEFHSAKYRNNDVELQGLNLPKQRPSYPRESSRNSPRPKGETGCCIIM